MKKLIAIIFLLLLMSVKAYSDCSDNVQWEWSIKENHAYFEFKSASSKTIKISNIALLTSNNVEITELGSEYYLKPFNVINEKFYIGNLNKGMIKFANYRCIFQEKKTGKEYVDSVKWKNSSTMAYNDCGFTGVLCTAYMEAKTTSTTAWIGSSLTVFNKNGDKIETFQVRKIFIDHDKKQCWVSKKNEEKFKDYLSIMNCTIID